MSMHKGLIGKDEGGASVKQEQTLGEYIARVTRRTAFDQVAKEKKLTFDEWFSLNSHKILFMTTAEYSNFAWKAAQENM